MKRSGVMLILWLSLVGSIWLPGATMVSRQIDAAARGILGSKFSLVFPGVVSLTANPLGFARGLLVQDPDGHAVQLIER